MHLVRLSRKAASSRGIHMVAASQSENVIPQQHNHVPLLGKLDCHPNPFQRPNITETESEKRPIFPSIFIHALRDKIPLEQRNVAVDCACGPGLFTPNLALEDPIGLGFQHVLAIDRNATHLTKAQKHPAITYVQGDVLHIPMEDDSAQLVTIVQALHWLPQREFLNESIRVLDKGGVFAAMGYAVPMIMEHEAQRHFHDYYFRTLGSHLPRTAPGNMWQCDRRQVDSAHESQSFAPLKGVVRMSFQQEHTVPIASFFRFLKCSSAYHVLLEKQTTTSDPLDELETKIRSSLGKRGLPTDTLHVTIPFWMIMGVNE